MRPRPYGTMLKASNKQWLTLWQTSATHVMHLYHLIPHFLPELTTAYHSKISCCLGCRTCVHG